MHLLSLEHAYQKCSEEFIRGECSDNRLITHFGEAKKQRMESLLLAINSIRESLYTMKVRDDMDPLKVLGVECTSQIPLWILSTLVLSIVILAQYMLIGELNL